MGCTNLETLTLPETIILDYTAFYDYDGGSPLVKLCFANDNESLLYLKANNNNRFAVLMSNPENTSFSIDENTRVIASGAFAQCSNMSSITIPNSVKTLGENVFYNCTNLSRVSLGSGVVRVGEGAFYCGSPCVNIYITATSSNFSNAQQITAFVDSLAGGLSLVQDGEFYMGFEYVIKGNEGEYVDYNEAYDWSSRSVQNAKIYYHTSLSAYFEDVFENASSSALTLTPRATIEMPVGLGNSIWQLGEVATSFMIKVDFKSNNREFHGLLYNDHNGLVGYVTDWDGFFDDPSDETTIFVACDGPLGWNDDFKEIRFVENAVAYTFNNNTNNFDLDISEDFVSLLSGIADFQGYYHEAPETGIVLDVILPSTIIGLVALATVMVWKSKEQY